MLSVKIFEIILKLSIYYQPSMTSDPIIISFPDLQSGAADQRFPDAFGPHSLGIIVVRGNIVSSFLHERIHS